MRAEADLEAERVACERARAGDRDALGGLLRAYGPILYRSVLLPKLGSDAAAQDALADTYARVVERFGQFQWQGAGVYPWLRVIATRIAIDQLRSRRREALYEPDDLEREIDQCERDPSAFADVELCERRDMADARSRVDAALGRIHARYATAIRLRVLEERPREEVAAALGVTVATFDVVLHRALTALKKALAEGRSDELDTPKEKGAMKRELKLRLIPGGLAAKAAVVEDADRLAEPPFTEDELAAAAATRGLARARAPMRSRARSAPPLVRAPSRTPITRRCSRAPSALRPPPGSTPRRRPTSAPPPKRSPARSPARLPPRPRATSPASPRPSAPRTARATSLRCATSCSSHARSAAPRRRAAPRGSRCPSPWPPRRRSRCSSRARRAIPPRPRRSPARAPPPRCSTRPSRFPREGGASARIDRIARARSADLRDNRFAAWGVR